MAQYSNIRAMLSLSLSLSLSPSPYRVNGGLTAGQLGIVLNRIEEHLTKPVGLAELAWLVRLSPSHFCRAFRQSVGMPPKRYRKRRRMELAKSLLVKRASVTEVGLVLGYSETSSFTTAFHKTTGFTPTAYRRSVLNACHAKEGEP